MFEKIKAFFELPFWQNKNNIRAVFVFSVIALSHNLILINEEILVAFCFFCAIGYIYYAMSQSVVDALNERSQGIRKELSMFLLLKQENIEELYKTEESFLNTTTNIQSLQNYCQEHFAQLNENQHKALSGLIAQNLNTQLIALRTVQESVQPVLHKHIHRSFRAAVLENFSAKYKAQSIHNCLNQMKDLS